MIIKSKMEFDFGNEKSEAEALLKELDEASNEEQKEGGEAETWSAI